MKNLSILFLIIVLADCNNEKKSSDTAAQNDSASVKTKGQPVVNATTGFSLGSFDRMNTPLKDSVKGNIVDGANWTDAEGENTVLLTQTENRMVNGTQSQRIYAYCYKKEAGAWKQKWLVQDRIDDCEVDATCEFLPQSLTVTDNDKNNTAEVTFLYKLSCKGDVSPDQKKLIMYEGNQKYAIRGTTIIEYNGGKEGGDKKIDPVFNNAPRSLLDFANIQWDKFGLTRY
jgi:hypothetical protein